MRSIALSALCAALCAATAIPAAAQTPITLDQAMSHPDWIGTPVETAWWNWDGKRVYYRQKRAGSPLRDTFQVDTAAAPRLVGDAELAGLDSATVVYHRDRSRAIVFRNGDLFERDLKSGALAQITRGMSPSPAAAQYSADGRAVQFRAGADWYSWNRAERMVAPVALPRAARDPAAPPEAGQSETALRDMQLRLIATLQRQKDERDALRERAEQERRADATRAPQAVYLGDKEGIDGSALSPDGRYLLVATSPKGDKGRASKMPRYVTESGYEESDDERTRVGRDTPKQQSLHLVDLRTRKVTPVSYDALPGVGADPLAALREEQKLPALKGNRAVRLDDESGGGMVWSGDGARVAVMLRAVDNKDRWIAAVDLADGGLKPLHRVSDTAWINNSYNQFGWLPDHATLWFLSEESGYAHLYTLGADGRRRALTQGAWEATNVRWSADGSVAHLLCNRKTPGAYEVCAVDARDGSVREVTALDGGVEQFSVSPDERKLLVHYSSAYLPAQIATVPAAGGAAVKLTDTRTPEFKARQWVQPQLVAVPSTHGAGPIWSKLYRPATLEAGRKYPVVLFVHGAGYLQNATKRYSNYFREQMFHNLLVEKGYIVLDMDYRASKGYGRDWRTAIYRQMGHPELEDYVDGANWMAANHQGDIDKVGIYGGSYGGFMTFMAMLREPALFKSGAALRPVTDWTTYNHEYTSNILNTPELDPRAYRKSSPIEYADKLQGHLLIAHGMVDDNVFYQDSVRMAQRLIELRKDNWELASYPLERHAYLQPESWYDQYRRIYQLFERTLKK
ncbi:prolyl oligopeptidase family serine peptidase [Pseudoduganella namucuonensis]|uniref:Dipeptidyl aminopeptidase/acylaminoacyl peptidase n=1 Tax=Pseudoduganella namucuonensis TaxID=1035707 RepID=A0A1I7F6C4_9BURK|nr:prolyl oligopeptidase family serine peptidase [Pseudoduganella namucuonensis]SFU31685.1 Dipeptidyl aminopeptidase/acylaminoacyl peptidase [Pseudoduganella namucuonensis]